MKPTKKKTKPSKAGSSNPMDVDFLQRLCDLMESNHLNAVELRDGERRIILRRGAGEPAVVPVHALPVGGLAAVPPPSPGSPTPASEDAGLLPIKSPMVGTFYAAASPDAKPLASVGDVIEEDADVCIIEAMKVFNTIKAECRGTIARILVENGKPVEYGQALFLVKPN